jgi:hypothetical protein
LQVALQNLLMRRFQHGSSHWTEQLHNLKPAERYRST